MEITVWKLRDIVITLTATCACTWPRTATFFWGGQILHYSNMERNGRTLLHFNCQVLSYTNISMTATFYCTETQTAAAKSKLLILDKTSFLCKMKEIVETNFLDLYKHDRIWELQQQQLFSYFFFSLYIFFFPSGT